MKKIILASVVVVAVAIGGFLYWFFQDDAPDAVSLEAGVEQVTDDTEAPDATTVTDTSTAPATDGVSGPWTVDAETGEFDYESATGSFVGFRVNEELAGIGSATAVGRTGEVAGSIELDGTALIAATFEVDMTTITTNESRRDDRVQGALDTANFPTATFTLTAPVDLGADAVAGEPVSVLAPGDLTVHGITQAVEFPIEAQLVGDTIVVVVGSLEIVFADYDVEVPSASVVLSAEDNGILEFQLLFTRA